MLVAPLLDDFFFGPARMSGRVLERDPVSGRLAKSPRDSKFNLYDQQPDSRRVCDYT
jgi:hypothetical protein